MSAQATTRAPSRGSSPLPERSTRFNTPPSPVRSISGGSAAHVTMPALNDVQTRLRHDETRGCGASPTAAKTSDASMAKQPTGSSARRRLATTARSSLRFGVTHCITDGTNYPLSNHANSARRMSLGSRSDPTLRHAARACTPPSTTKFRATMLCHTRTIGRL